MHEIFFPSPPSIPAFLTGGAALCALLFWCYLKPIGAPSARWRAIFICLRAAALALLMFFILDPFARSLANTGGKRTLAVLVDASRSMSVGDGIGNAPRIEDARRAAALTREQTDASAADGIAAKLFAFSENVVRLASPADMKPDGIRTDIAGALTSILSTEGADLEAALLVSDGAAGDAPEIAPVIAAFRARGKRVFVLPVGIPGTLRDARVANTSILRRASIGTEVSLDAFIESRGFDGVEASLDLLREGELIQSRKVKLADGTIKTRLNFTPEQEGYLRYTVRIAPPDGDAVPENNAETVVIDSRRSRIRVLYMEGSQYRQQERKLWEFQYFVQALEEDRDIRVTSVFKDDVAAAQKAGIGYVRDPERGFPTERGKLFEYDVIVSSDIDIEYFTPEQLRNTSDFVALHGGGFLMIGGYTAFGAGGYDESAIDKLLPVDMQGRRDGYFEDYQDQFRPVLTPEGLEHPVCALSPDAEENGRIWEKIPPFAGFNYTEKAKSGATVLAVHPTRRNQNGPYVILSVQQYGRGRSMAFTTDTTAGWGNLFEAGWGEGDGDNRHFRRFWQNAVRWLASYRINLPNKQLMLSTPVNRYSAGDMIEISAECLDKDYLPTARAEVRGSVKLPGEESRELVFRPDSSNPWRYRSQFRASAQGRYELRAAASLEGEELAEDLLVLFCDDSDAELRSPEPNHDLLKRIAGETGGRIVAESEISGVVGELAEKSLRRREVASARFWTRSVFLILTLGALSLEWFLRRRVGLP
ncbi:MAG TPA: glutamine amidotransferase [Candidatus Brocadiia bacterium]|nr:glutamine amidotransferase [Candidatus Brocadiia bacterium]